MPDIQTNFEKNENNQTAPKTHKKTAIRVAVLVVVLIIIIGVALSQTVFLTDEQKDERIAEIYINEGYDAARDAIIDYYGRSSDKTLSWLMAISEFEDEELAEQVEIVDQNLSVRDTGNYFDYEVTVKNNSDETLSYIEVNIYLKNASEEIIYSDWTNWSGSLPPGGFTMLDTMIPYQEGVEYYSVSVAEAN